MQYNKKTKLKIPYMGYKTSTNLAKPIPANGMAIITTINIPLL